MRRLRPDLQRSVTQQKAQTLEANRTASLTSRTPCSAPFIRQDAGKRARWLVRFAQIFADSPYANQALGVAATAYQQAQNRRRCSKWPTPPGERSQQRGNAATALRYYGEKGEQLDKAEAYSKKAMTCWKPQKSQRKMDRLISGAAERPAKRAGAEFARADQHSEKITAAVTNFRAAAPLLKPDDGSYARNSTVWDLPC